MHQTKLLHVVFMWHLLQKLVKETLIYSHKEANEYKNHLNYQIQLIESDAALQRFIDLSDRCVRLALKNKIKSYKVTRMSSEEVEESQYSTDQIQCLSENLQKKKKTICLWPHTAALNAFITNLLYMMRRIDNDEQKALLLLYITRMLVLARRGKLNEYKLKRRQ